MREAVSGAAARLAAGGAASAMLDARLLLFASTGRGAEDYIRDPGKILTEAAADCFAALVVRREGGEPVSRILGSREFYGRDFRLSDETLDPRPDTETLIDAVLESRREKAAPRILDLGVGSGAILLTLLAEIPDATGVGIDRSPAALRTARSNAVALGLQDRAAFCCGDWLSPLGGGAFDIVVANPPYIPSAEVDGLAVEVRAHDPILALDGGTDGLQAYIAILDRAPHVMDAEGQLFFEIGETQGEAVAALMEEAGLMLDETKWLWRDLAGRPRCVAGKRQVRRSGAVLSQVKKELGTAAASG